MNFSGLPHSITLLFLFGLATTTQAFPIAQDGQAVAMIVVSDSASAPIRHAADELATFLEQVTSARFVINHSATAGQPRILVGPGAAQRADADFSAQDLGAEGYIIRTHGNDLILAGGEPRGTLYAVYSFLEDHVGCRWWTSTVSAIPRKTTLKIGPLSERFVPVLEYRESFWYDAFDGDWAVRNKMNGHRVRVSEKQGGKHIYEGFVHTFELLIPPEKYYAAHPEWFSLVNGERLQKRPQLCLTNTEMRAELIRNLKAKLQANPKATIASVSQNDGRGRICECANCVAVDSAEGSNAGTMLRFVNAVAEAIEPEFPDVTISTLAYLFTRQPPKITKPRDDVIVRLCSIECSFSQPLTDKVNQAFRDDIIGWSKICDRLYIWDYNTNFNHYLAPHPNLRVLGPNIRFFVKHHAKGIFAQGAYQSPGAEMAELRAWVLAKLLWNPKLGADKLIAEFLAGYYGPAAPHIAAYLNVLHDAVEASGDYLDCYTPVTAKYLSLETMSKAIAHLKAAQAAVRDHADLSARVEMTRLPTMYVFLMRWPELRATAKQTNAAWPLAETRDAVLAEFMRIAKAAGVTHIRERDAGFDYLHETLKKQDAEASATADGT